MVNSMTYDEIIKALKCCRDIDIKCETCQLWTVSECTKVLHQATIDLIDRLKEENEVLKSVNENHKNVISMLNKPFDQIKSETYKECIEKVKENSRITEMVCSGALIRTDYIITKEKLDNLLKESITNFIWRML